MILTMIILTSTTSLLLLTCIIKSLIYFTSYKYKMNYFNKKLNNKSEVEIEIVLQDIYSYSYNDCKRKKVYKKWLMKEMEEFNNLFNDDF